MEERDFALAILFETDLVRLFWQRTFGLSFAALGAPVLRRPGYLIIMAVDVLASNSPQTICKHQDDSAMTILPHESYYATDTMLETFN